MRNRSLKLTFGKIRMSLKCDSLDCKRRGSDNATGDIPFIAPMKIKYLRSLVLENKQRGGVALLFFVCLILLGLTPGAAQLKNQRRVTALQLGEAPEGSRVTIVSDSPLNDYEAFRRGDRFYVKIPLADLFSAVPHFKADGFADVQVQRVGDGLMVSFKLQPGASARVDQHANRLDVVFSAPNKSSYNNSASAGWNRTTGYSGVPRIESPQTSGAHDAAGPMPPASGSASRERLVAEAGEPGNIDRGTENPSWQFNPKASARKPGISQPTTANAAVTSPSPGSSPSSILTPSTSYPSLTTATPASARPVSGSSVPGGFLNWRNRQSAALRWISANRLATLVGALILLSLILYLATAVRRKQMTVVKAKRGKAPKVQPKYSPTSELNELSSAGSNEQLPGRDIASQQPSSMPSGATPPPVANAPSPNVPWVLTRPTIVSSTADRDEHSSEEQEREVFEL
jgi:hypothetical protein